MVKNNIRVIVGDDIVYARVNDDLFLEDANFSLAKPMLYKVYLPCGEDCDCGIHPCIDMSKKTTTILIHDVKPNTFSAVLADVSVSPANGYELSFHQPLSFTDRHYYFPIATKLTPVSYIQRVTRLPLEYVKLWYPPTACRHEMGHLMYKDVVLVGKHKFHSVANINRKLTQHTYPDRYAMSYWTTDLEERDFGPKANILHFFLKCSFLDSFDLETCFVVPNLTPVIEADPTELVPDASSQPVVQDSALIPESDISTIDTELTLPPEAANPEAVSEVSTPSKLDSLLPNPLDTPEVRAAFKSMQNTYYETFIKSAYTPPLGFEEVCRKQHILLQSRYK